MKQSYTVNLESQFDRVIENNYKQKPIKLKPVFNISNVIITKKDKLLINKFNAAKKSLDN